MNPGPAETLPPRAEAPAKARTAEAPASGWRARLALRLHPGARGTTLQRRDGHGPLYVQKPFYPEGDPAHVYLLHPPGGVVGGDRLDVSVSVDDGAHALLTTPAATKFYASAGAEAVLVQSLHVAAGAVLEWLPQENIFFGGSRSRIETRVSAEDGARFLGWDITCLGRPASGDAFSEGRIAVTLSLPRLFERNLWRAGSADLTEPWGLGGRTVVGSLYALPADPDLAPYLRRRVPAPADAEAAVSVVDGHLIARILCQRSATARSWLENVWAALRPPLLGREACIPRIWLT